jgi:hypothetical protein
MTAQRADILWHRPRFVENGAASHENGGPGSDDLGCVV